jgi:hypothetical protein
MSDPTATEALKNITEYVRQRRQHAARGQDREVIHGVQWDPEGEMAELTVSDLETLLALFSKVPTDVELRTWGQDPIFLASGSSVRFYLSPDPRDRNIITVSTTSTNRLEVYGERSLAVRPKVSNTVEIELTR